jgi:hypothetical protein
VAWGLLADTTHTDDVRLLGMVTVKETVDKYTLFPEFHTWSRLEDPHSHRHGAKTTEDQLTVSSQSAHSQLLLIIDIYYDACLKVPTRTTMNGNSSDILNTT